MYTLITIAGIAVAIFFLAGFWRGCMNAVAEYRAGTPEPDSVQDYHYHYGGFAALSVIASAGIIAGVGFSPAMIYAGPLLALVTATGCGLAFFMEGRPAR